MSGGISHYLYEIIRFLPPEHVRVIALQSQGWQDFDKEQAFSIRRLKLPLKSNNSSSHDKYLAPFFFKEMLREKDASIVLCGQAYHSLLMPAWLLQKLNGSHFGVFTHGLDLLRPQNRRYKWFFNQFLLAAEIVFANSQASANIGQNLGVKPEKIHVVHPSVNISRLKSSITPQDVRQQHGLYKKKCLLTVGRLVERKGCDTVIRAMPLILNTVPDAHYLIVGSGPWESRLKSMVIEMGLERHVTFTGYVPDDKLSAYYLASDVFVMISREILEHGDLEGFGIVYLEANLLGKPVVAGRSGGVTDAVVHEETGLLVNPDDLREISNGIIRLLSNPEFAKTLGENGRNRVKSSFNGRIAAQEVLNALTRINNSNRIDGLKEGSQ
jgi:phosphatidylinositol alpha-1,6-mannosyltransferase